MPTRENVCLLYTSRCVYATGDTLNVLWFPEGEESPFTLGAPMETLGEAIRLAGE